MTDPITTPAEALRWQGNRIRDRAIQMQGLAEKEGQAWYRDVSIELWSQAAILLCEADNLASRITEPDGDAVERVARALCRADGRNPDDVTNGSGSTSGSCIVHQYRWEIYTGWASDAIAAMPSPDLAAAADSLRDALIRAQDAEVERDRLRAALERIEHEGDEHSELIARAALEPPL